ncbi:MAG: iron-sulfur cluster insertion protein ErpA [Armatimonadetes bacterium]|nr:iron-sulfur cluster insertion protein ErpA [Armatimonadota bacterium]
MSVPTSLEDQAIITLSERAATEIKSLLERQGKPDAVLRVFVSGGGCSGLQYGMAIDEEMEEGDQITDQHGVKVVIDSMSLQYIAGSTVDYIEDMMGGGFKIDNPNAVHSCGCGHSFSTEEGEEGGCGSGCGCGH